MLRSTLLLAAKVAAGTRTRNNRWLLTYFILQVIADLASIAEGFHLESDNYAAVWTVTNLCIFIASAGYVLECFHAESLRLKFAATVECLMLPVFVVGLAVFSLQGYLSRGIVLAMGSSAVLLALGVGLATVASWEPIRVTLASLWLLMAFWNYAYGYGEHYAEKLFDGLNQWLPAALVCISFTVIAFQASSKVSPHSYPKS